MDGRTLVPREWLNVGVSCTEGEPDEAEWRHPGPPGGRHQPSYPPGIAIQPANPTQFSKIGHPLANNFASAVMFTLHSASWSSWGEESYQSGTPWVRRRETVLFQEKGVVALAKMWTWYRTAREILARPSSGFLARESQDCLAPIRSKGRQNGGRVSARGVSRGREGCGTHRNYSIPAWTGNVLPPGL